MSSEQTRKSAPVDFDFNNAWNWLLSIKEGEGYYGFDQFFKSESSKIAARCMLVEGQANGVFAVFCEDFFVEEIDTKDLAEARKVFRTVLEDIQARRGEWV